MASSFPSGQLRRVDFPSAFPWVTFPEFKLGTLGPQPAPRPRHTEVFGRRQLTFPLLSEWKREGQSWVHRPGRGSVGWGHPAPSGRTEGLDHGLPTEAGWPCGICFRTRASGANTWRWMIRLDCSLARPREARKERGPSREGVLSPVGEPCWLSLGLAGSPVGCAAFYSRWGRCLPGHPASASVILPLGSAHP